ncbi:MAG: sigma-70 family RNA polymerase sigma factor [Chloroflexota bacterium]|nr:sigma-70 family RNA polymerase sigma factor [Chloroflexota bacterium]
MVSQLAAAAAAAVPTAGLGHQPAITAVEGATDDQLVARAVTGDVEAFGALAERYKRPVYALAYRMLGNAADAEDAAQETLVRAYTRLTTYQPGGKFGSWLLAITSHWCIDYLRRRRAVSLEAVTEGAAGGAGLGVRAPLPGLPEELEQPEALAMQAERRMEVQGWLASLPAPYRRVLVLRYWHDLSYAEISRAIGQPVSTVRMRLFRARQFLGKTCGEEYAALTGVPARQHPSAAA